MKNNQEAVFSTIWKNSVNLSKNIYIKTMDLPEKTRNFDLYTIRKNLIEMISSISNLEYSLSSDEIYNSIQKTINAISKLEYQLILTSSQFSFRSNLFLQELYKIKKSILNLMKKYAN